MLFRSLRLPDRWMSDLNHAVGLCCELQNIKNSPDLIDWKPSQWCAVLEAKSRPQVVVSLALIRGAHPRSVLLKWLYHWRHVKSVKSPADLIAEGWIPGPALGAELTKRRAQALDLGTF